MVEIPVSSASEEYSNCLQLNLNTGLLSNWWNGSSWSTKLISNILFNIGWKTKSPSSGLSESVASVSVSM